MNCRGLHCPSCHRSGPAGPLTALLVLLAISAAARAVTRILPILLHILIVTTITATSAAIIITAAVLTARRPARPGRQPLRRPPARTIPDTASHRRTLPAPPGPRALPALAAIPDATPPPAPHRASGKTPPP
jgi:hypothetical protein